jgi:hypothetical protein
MIELPIGSTQLERYRLMTEKRGMNMSNAQGSRRQRGLLASTLRNCGFPEVFANP